MLLKDLVMDVFYYFECGGQFFVESFIKIIINLLVFGCIFVDLMVDIVLCKVIINCIFNVYDLGYIFNLLLVEGQVYGGMGMGIGWVLFEEMIIDVKSGVVRNFNLLDYKMLIMLDLL